MGGLTAFRCRACDAVHPFLEGRWRCDCGGLLDLDFAPALDPARLSGAVPTLWRYRTALPLPKEADVVSLGEGFTPLTPARLDGVDVWLKQDHLFPSGSYKDRGASLLIGYARALGVDAVVEDSSGNAGSAMAAYSAAAGLACTVYVPESASPGKLVQMAAYGAGVVRVPGSREATALAVREAAAQSFYASHVWHPLFTHGVKTVAYELWEQLGRRAPETVVVPAGNGSLLLGVDLGFRELVRLGLAARRPRLIAVQAANCAPLHAAFVAGAAETTPFPSTVTVAEGVAIADPARGAQMLAAIRTGGGSVLAVSEAEIGDALRLLHRRGFYVEPTSAVAVAGLRRHFREGPLTDRPVAILTGHGLKATDRIASLG
jgi:threonine synthase